MSAVLTTWQRARLQELARSGLALRSERLTLQADTRARDAAEKGIGHYRFLPVRDVRTGDQILMRMV